MVFATDTVVYPLTVVIESINTLVAYVAVPRVRTADDFAGWTEDVWLKLLNQLQERNLLGAAHKARLLLGGDYEEGKANQEE